MKKLFYIVNIRLPTEKAHGIQIMKTCEAFADLGMDVELVIPNRKTPILEDSFDYYRVKKNFKILRRWCLDTVRFGYFGYWVELLSFAERTAWSILFQKGTFYTRDEFIAFYLAIIGKKVFWEAHMGQKNFFVKILMYLKAPVVVISNGLKDFYVEMGFSEQRILVASDAIDPDQFNISIDRDEVRKKLELEPNDKVVMYIGTLDDWKGYQTFLEASKLTVGNDIRFVVIGGSEEKIEKLKTEYPKVKFLGYHPYSELPQNQKVADILVIPNSGKMDISSKFTSPMKLFAHMASGVPLIVSDLPSLREIVNEKSAYFFEADNPKNLAEVIDVALSNSEESEKKSKHSLEVILEYTWDNRVRKILNFIS